MYIHDTIAEDIDVVVIWVGISGDSAIDLVLDVIVGSIVDASERAAVGMIVVLIRVSGGDADGVSVIELHAVDVVVKIAVCVNVITCSYNCTP